MAAMNKTNVRFFVETVTKERTDISEIYLPIYMKTTINSKGPK